MGENTKALDLIGPVPINIGTVHIHGSPVSTETVHIHRSLVDIKNVHVHGSMQIGVRIPQKDGPIMPPWML